FAIRSIAAGDFTGRRREEMAVLGDDARLRGLSPVEGQVAESRGVAEAGGKDLADWRVQELTTGNWSETAKLVRARVSAQPVDSLLVVDGVNHQVEVIAAPAGATSSRALSGWTEGRALRARLEAREAPVAVLPM